MSEGWTKISQEKKDKCALVREKYWCSCSEMKELLCSGNWQIPRTTAERRGEEVGGEKAMRVERTPCYTMLRNFDFSKNKGNLWKVWSKSECLCYKGTLWLLYGQSGWEVGETGWRQEDQLGIWTVVHARDNGAFYWCGRVRNDSGEKEVYSSYLQKWNQEWFWIFMKLNKKEKDKERKVEKIPKFQRIKDYRRKQMLLCLTVKQKLILWSSENKIKLKC